MLREMAPRSKVMFWGAVFSPVVGVGIWLLLAYYPAYHRYFPHCPFYELTHLYCPGCGATRGMFQLLHGNIPGVFRNNALLIPSLCLVCFLMYRGRAAFSPPVLTGYIGLIVAFWILRNIPLYPFNLLAPIPFAS